MDIAQAKRRENIAEYILYLWQLEDLLRALQFSPEAIFSTLIAPRKDIADEQKHVFLLWYMDIANLLHQEGKDEKGHLEHTLHLIGDLHDLHLQLMKLPVGEHYRRTYARLEPELPRLRAVLGNPGMNDTELCFRALYAAMLYRIKGEGEKSAVADTLEFISPVIAELADMHRLPIFSRSDELIGRVADQHVDVVGLAARGCRMSPWRHTATGKQAPAPILKKDVFSDILLYHPAKSPPLRHIRSGYSISSPMM